MTDARIDRRRTGLATRADLLAATTRLLEAGSSMSALRVERIVEEAGKSPATFYLHFKDKTELLAALAEDQVAWRDTIGAEALADPALSREAVHAMHSEIVGRWIDNRAVLAAIIEVAEHDPQMNEIWRTAWHEVAHVAAAQIRLRWQGEPDRHPDPETLAEIFTWMTERTCHQILRDPGRRDDVTQGLTDIVWRVLTYPSDPARK